MPQRLSSKHRLIWTPALDHEFFIIIDMGDQYRCFARKIDFAFGLWVMQTHFTKCFWFLFLCQGSKSWDKQSFTVHGTQLPTETEAQNLFKRVKLVGQYTYQPPKYFFRVAAQVHFQYFGPLVVGFVSFIEWKTKIGHSSYCYCHLPLRAILE